MPIAKALAFVCLIMQVKNRCAPLLVRNVP